METTRSGRNGSLHLSVIILAIALVSTNLSSMETRPRSSAQMYATFRLPGSFSICFAAGKRTGIPRKSLNCVVTIKKIRSIKTMSGRDAVGMLPSTRDFLLNLNATFSPWCSFSYLPGKPLESLLRLCDGNPRCFGLFQLIQHLDIMAILSILGCFHRDDEIRIF